MESATTSRSENLGTTPQQGTFPFSFTRFPANYLHISRIFLNFAMKLCMALMALYSLDATKALIICDMRNFFNIKVLTNQINQ